MSTGQLAPGPIYFCGVPPEALELAQRGLARWNKRHLTWIWIDTIRGMTLAIQNADTDWVLNGQWSSATNGYFTFSPTPVRETADLILTTRPIDGSGRVLAETELPPGDDRQLHGWFDISERWGIDIVFKLTLLHELGHFMGLGHLGAGVAAVMQPVYNPSLVVLQPRDREAILGIYPDARTFQPAPTPTPTPAPIPPPSADPLQIPISVLMPNASYQGYVKKIL